MIVNPRILLLVVNVLRDKRLRTLMIVLLVVVVFLFSMALYVVTHPWVLVQPNSVDKVAPNLTEQQFIDAVAKDAKALYKDYKLYPSVTIAQAILESSWGKSGLTKRANNLFGIKAFNWLGPVCTMPTNEEYNGVTIQITANFRAYATWYDSIVDHAMFLKVNSRYEQAGVFSAKSFQEQASALQFAGYATDSNYSKSLITLIMKYDLSKYDVEGN